MVPFKKIIPKKRNSFQRGKSSNANTFQALFLSTFALKNIRLYMDLYNTVARNCGKCLLCKNIRKRDLPKRSIRYNMATHAIPGTIQTGIIKTTFRYVTEVVLLL